MVHQPDGDQNQANRTREPQVVRGARPGNRYVRIIHATELPETAPAEYIVAAPTEPESTLGRAVRTTQCFLFGPPLATAQEIHERLTKIKALAVLSSDALSSVAYATEETMRILVLAGIAALTWTLPLTIAVLVVLATVVTSYQQTIHAYPSGGGSYIVASDNLGEIPGLVAAAALLTDYILTVAVSIAAGVLAITSAFPSLDPYRVELALAAIILMVIGNLRGIREAGTIFAAPTYIFVVALLGLIAYGLWRYVAGTLPSFSAPPAWLNQERGIQVVSLFLILRAFSSGAVALTGTEAISNGVPAFKPPESRNARITLIWMGSLLGVMFFGTSFLARHMGIIPDPTQTESVLSIVARLLVGKGWYFYLIQFATMFVLVLAANTSFADFPRLLSILARDRYAPRQFAYRGNRLAFNAGILSLAIVAGLLVVIFRGSVSALIPLYSVGVFTAFTLSQAGMVVHWRRLRSQGWWWRALINGAGVIMTGAVAIVIAVTKFVSGAWIVLVLVPLIVWQLRKIHRHYERVGTQLGLEPSQVPASTAVRRPEGFPVIVPLETLSKASLQAIEYARHISNDVTVVHVADSRKDAEALQQQWRAFDMRLPLTIIESPYREIIGPLVRYIEQQHGDTGSDGTLTVVVPEFVPAHLYEVPLHNQTAWRLRTTLWTHPGIVVTSVPYRLRD